VFVDDVDLEEDSRSARKKFKQWRDKMRNYFFAESDTNASDKKVSRRFSAFDFSKSTLPKGQEGGVVSHSKVIDLDQLRGAEASPPPEPRNSLQPSLATSYHNQHAVESGESPFFRESHGGMIPTNTSI